MDKVYQPKVDFLDEVFIQRIETFKSIDNVEFRVESCNNDSITIEAVGGGDLEDINFDKDGNLESYNANKFKIDTIYDIIANVNHEHEQQAWEMEKTEEICNDYNY